MNGIIRNFKLLTSQFMFYELTEIFFRLSPSLSVDSILGRKVGSVCYHQPSNQDVEYTIIDEVSGPSADIEVPGPSADIDVDFNKSFSILSDLKTQMFR